MANRNFYSNHKALEVDNVSLWCKIDVGSSGSVSAFSGLGIASVVKEVADGRYTITLTDSYNTLLWSSITLESTAFGGTVGRILSSNVTAATPTLLIQLTDTTTNTDANVISGDKLYIKIELRNSSVTNT